jgi:hypothetical protein
MLMQCMYVKPFKNILLVFRNPKNLVGFEPRSPVSEAEASAARVKHIFDPNEIKVENFNKNFLRNFQTL